MKTRRGRAAAVTAEAVADAIRGAVQHFQDPTRTALVEFLQLVAQSEPKAALSCADNAAGILHQLTQSQQSIFLEEAAGLALLPESGPRAAPEFFLRCVDLPRYLDKDDLHSWTEQGRDVGRGNPAAAEAYFRLESAASVLAVKRLRRSVHIGEVGRLLKLYCTAVGGKDVGLKSTVEAPKELIREGHHLPLTDGDTIYLPDHLAKHSSHDENFGEYKVLAAHQAGYIEFGTFDLDLDALMDHSAIAALARKNGGAKPAPLVSHYELFFRLFDDPRLARDIFFAVEDGRVDFRLRKKYRGLAGDLAKVALDALDGRSSPSALPLREALVEGLVRLSVTGQIEESLPEDVMPIYRRVCGMFSPVLNRNATVDDSAVATARIYLLLDTLPNVPLQSESCRDAVRKIEPTPPEKPGGFRARKGERPEPGIPDSAIQPYQSTQPVEYRGQTRPELVQLEMAIEMLRDAMADSEETGIPLTREMLEELLKRGAKIKISQMTSKELAEASGLFITDLEGLPQEKIEELSAEEKKKLSELLQQAAVVRSEEPGAEPAFYYDEWDYLIGDYRPRWCKLREISLEGESGEIAARIRKEHSPLISAVRRHFQRIRPEMLRRVKRLRSGEEIEIDDAIEAAVDRRAGLTPSDRIYQKRERRARDVATAFLLDLSASTDEWIVKAPPEKAQRPVSAFRARPVDIFSQGTPESGEARLGPPEGSKRVIDIEREALVIMAEALESLGDEYAIYGFSGYGRDGVEFFPIKDFSEAYSERVRCRIGAMEPRKSTRMGPAIRHALKKLEGTDSRLKALILLSDGYPQDFDYGPDRSSRDYGLHDTAMALQEAKRKGVHTFCVTVDQAGNDYLKEMCGGENYLVVKRPSALPRILPRVYRGLTV